VDRDAAYARGAVGWWADVRKVNRIKVKFRVRQPRIVTEIVRPVTIIIKGNGR
jgi:hypothetical protein